MCIHASCSVEVPDYEADNLGTTKQKPRQQTIRFLGFLFLFFFSFFLLLLGGIIHLIYIYNVQMLQQMLQVLSTDKCGCEKSTCTVV